jgi:23S rRNA pseudouridine1911/1915/1917 synthase
MSNVYSFVVEEAGTRLDKYIGEKCQELSRAHAQKLISEGYVTVNNRVARASLKLDTGDQIAVEVPPTAPSPLTPEDIPLNIIFEDDDVLVIDKPAGMVVHPAPGHYDHTMVNAVLHHLPDLTDAGDALRPGVVHRLDKDTSGLILIAKNRLSHAKLVDQFKLHAVDKTYITLVKGHLTPGNGAIEAPIGRDPRNRKRMAVVSTGREACTEYNVTRYIGDYTLLEVKLATGRTHQIRVHLSAIGYPVAGDTTYGRKSPDVPRQFIHAYRLGFYLPSTGEYVEFTADLPADLEQVLRDIG